MDIRKIRENYEHANVYVLCGESGLYLFDPSVSPQELVKTGLISFPAPADAENTSVSGKKVDFPQPIKGLFLTHGHYDHVREAASWKQAFPDLPLAAHRLSREVLQDPLENCSYLFGDRRCFSPPERLLEDGEIYLLEENLRLECFLMPGHSRDSLIYLVQERSAGEWKTEALVTGDLIFADSVGRSDLPGSDPEALRQSLRRLQLLFEEKGLSPELPIYPGHSVSTNLARERRENIFLRAAEGEPTGR